MAKTDAFDVPGLGKAYDISIQLGKEEPTYPGDTLFRREEISSVREGADYSLSALHLSAHAGTHIDAPAHFLENAKTIDQYPAGRFILPAEVVLVEDEESIKPPSIEGIEVKKGDALLFKTLNSARGLSISPFFSKSFVYMTKEAAELCIDLGAGMVGIDYISIDRYGDDASPAHCNLLKNDVLILEGINLKDVPTGHYTLFCLPLKVEGSEASPVRALLMC